MINMKYIVDMWTPIVMIKGAIYHERTNIMIRAKNTCNKETNNKNNEQMRATKDNKEDARESKEDRIERNILHS